MLSAWDWHRADALDQLPGRTALAGLLLAVFMVYVTVSAIREYLQISRLGGRAPVFRGMLPLGKVILLRMEKRCSQASFRY